MFFKCTIPMTNSQPVQAYCGLCHCGCMGCQGGSCCLTEALVVNFPCNNAVNSLPFVHATVSNSVQLSNRVQYEYFTVEETLCEMT